jgi:hypothetical protein
MIFQTIRPFAWFTLIVLSVIVVLIVGGVWWEESKNPVTCSKGQTLNTQNVINYVELQLRNQHPIEPYTESDFFLYLQRPPDALSSAVTVVRSAVGTYLPSTITIPLRKREPPNDTQVESARLGKLDLVSRKGLHRNFPFDSQSFKFALNFSADLPLNLLRITNRIPGFYVPCESMSVSFSPRELQIRFDFKRDRLTQLFAIMFVVVALVFAFIIIFQVKDVQALPMPIASYFISLWSLRRILESQIHHFPTIFDAMILGLSILLLVLLTLRVALSRFRRGRQFLG